MECERVQRDRDGERGVGRECGDVWGGGGYRVEGGVSVVDGGAERRADAGWGTEGAERGWIRRGGGGGGGHGRGEEIGKQ